MNDKRSHSRALLAFLIGLLCITPGGLAQDSGPKGVLEGKVTKRGTQEPIVDAVITLTTDSGQSRQATTGADGRFLLQDLVAAHYTVDVRRKGFILPRGLGPSNLSLAAGQKLKDISFRLVPTSTIAGRIIDDEGRPVTQFLVLAVRPQYDRGRRILNACTVPAGFEGARAVVDEQGKYRLFDLPPSEYYLAVVNRGCTTPPVYYPRVSDPADAIPVALAEGTNLSGIDLQIPKRDVYSVRFTVVEPPALPGRPSELVHVARRSRTGLLTEELNSQTQGRLQQSSKDTYVLGGLTRGSYEVGYSSDQNGRQMGYMNVNIVDRNIDAGVLVVRPSVTIVGRIHAAPGLTLDQSLLGKLRVRTQPVEGPEFLRSLFLTLPMPIEDDGAFTLHDLAQRRYQFRITGLPPDAYVASARYGGRNVLDEGLVVDGAPSGPLDVTLAGSGGIVTGVVQNAKNEFVADSDVVLLRFPKREEDLVSAWTARTDQSGWFSLRGVPPGEWSILAWEEVELGAYLNANFLRNVERLAVRVKVDAGASHNVVLRVIASPK